MCVIPTLCMIQTGWVLVEFGVCVPRTLFAEQRSLQQRSLQSAQRKCKVWRNKFESSECKRRWGLQSQLDRLQ